MRVKRRTASASRGFMGIPKAPEVFERGVTAAVEEGMLEAVGFVAVSGR